MIPAYNLMVDRWVNAIVNPMADGPVATGLKSDLLYSITVCIWAMAVVRGTCIHWSEL